jgi:hypothetical protein
MYGSITKLHRQIGVGVIAAEDGRRYRFRQSEVVNPRVARVGQEVDFLLAERRPQAIVVMAGSPFAVFGGR